MIVAAASDCQIPAPCRVSTVCSAAQYALCVIRVSDNSASSIARAACATECDQLFGFAMMLLVRQISPSNAAASNAAWLLCARMAEWIVTSYFSG